MRRSREKRVPAKTMLMAIHKGQMVVETELNTPDSLTQDEILNLLKGVHFWKHLHLGFSDFFKGKKFYNSLKNLSEKEYEILFLHYRYYLTFYEMINFGWDDVIEELRLVFDGIKLDDPGDLLELIIVTTAYDWVENPENLGCSQALYRAYKKVELKDYKGAEKYIRRIEKQTGKNRKEIPKSTLIIDYCLNVLSENKTKPIKTLVKNFKNADLEKVTFVVRKLRQTF